MDWINSTLFQAGICLGVTLSISIGYALKMIPSLILYRKKAHSLHHKELFRKLSKSGYAVYIPITIISDLDIKEQLTQEERMILNSNKLMIFKEGNPISSLYPQIGTSENEVLENRFNHKKQEKENS